MPCECHGTSQLADIFDDLCLKRCDPRQHLCYGSGVEKAHEAKLDAEKLRIPEEGFLNGSMPRAYPAGHQ